jgi:hypothetical protein
MKAPELADDEEEEEDDEEPDELLAPEPVEPVPLPPEPLDELEPVGAPVVVDPALTEEPTSPAMLRIVPLLGAVITVPATALCALFTAAFA